VRAEFEKATQLEQYAEMKHQKIDELEESLNYMNK
jgi:hypothetical protein